MQAQFEELARQHQDIEARELEVQRMSQTLNLNAVRDARGSATSVRAHSWEGTGTKASTTMPKSHCGRRGTRACEFPDGIPAIPLQGLKLLVRVFLRLWRPLLPVRMGLATGLLHKSLERLPCIATAWQG